MKYPLTQRGIELATFRFVAQHLSHCATAVPQNSSIGSYNFRFKESEIAFTLLGQVGLFAVKSC